MSSNIVCGPAQIIALHRVKVCSPAGLKRKIRNKPLTAWTSPDPIIFIISLLNISVPAIGNVQMGGSNLVHIRTHHSRSMGQSRTKGGLRLSLTIFKVKPMPRWGSNQF